MWSPSGERSQSCDRKWPRPPLHRRSRPRRQLPSLPILRDPTASTPDSSDGAKYRAEEARPGGDPDADALVSGARRVQSRRGGRVQEHYTRQSNGADFYATCSTRLKQSKMATDLERRQQGEQFRVMDEPNLPESPEFPRRQVFLSAAASPLDWGWACLLWPCSSIWILLYGTSAIFGPLPSYRRWALSASTVRSQ